jgi:hypothetical protein
MDVKYLLGKIQVCKMIHLKIIEQVFEEERESLKWGGA